MSNYHPIIDGPAEPVGLSMDANGNRPSVPTLGSPAKSRRVFVRLAWLYRTLIKAQHPFTGRGLAEQYEINVKTIERDIDSLRETGAIETVVIRNTDGRKGFAGRKVIACQCPFCGHQENAEVSDSSSDQ